LNRLVELKSKVMVTIKQQEEIQYLERLFKRYVCNFGKTESAGSRNRRALAELKS
jgi:hypothetical protein